MFPLYRFVALPKSFDSLYRVQLLYNRQVSLQNGSYLSSPQPHLLKSNVYSYSEVPPIGHFSRPLCTSGNAFNQVERRDVQELNLEQYIDQVKSKLSSNEICVQRPENNLKFIEYENLFAYNVLKDIKEYEQTVGFILAQVSHSLLDNSKQLWLANLSEFIFETNQSREYDGAVDALLRRIQDMNILEVIHFQKHLLSVIPYSSNETEWERIFLGSHFFRIWQKLDSVAVSLLAKSPLEQFLYELLAISDLWFELGLAKDVAFNRALMRKLLSHNCDLDKVSLMHLMFALNISRNIDPSQANSAFSIVMSYLDNHDNLSFDELAVIAMGFFKTKTKMPFALLSKFIQLATDQLSDDCRPFSSTIAVASILKLLRFSLETTEFDARILRDPVKVLVDRICDHKANLLDSNICLTHLILLLNSAYLQNSKRLYKTIFDRMISNLEGFRIKDIERILFCLANVLFRCPNYKLKALEDYLIKSEESQLYPYHVYNITYFLLVLEFYPHKLIQLCSDKEFLAKSVDSFKLNLNDTLLITDTILRLELQNRSILTQEQICEYQQAAMMTPVHSNTKKARFVKTIRDILSDSYADRLRLMYIFPFSKYPFPVILDKQAAQQVGQSTFSENIFKDSFPYTFEHIKPNQFRNCTAILVLLNKDKTYGPNIRGFTYVNKRLLEKLGFRVLLLEQSNFPDFVLPNHLVHSESDRFQQSAQSLLASVSATLKPATGR